MSEHDNEELHTNFLANLLSRPSTSPEDASCGRLDKTASHYLMDLGRRGLAVIFNQAGCENGLGFVANDLKSLCKTFVSLGFETELLNDLSFCEIQCALEDLSQRDHSDCDCFVLVYLNRGLEGKLRAKDRYFDINCLWRCFTAEQSPTLANKPKIFIVQAYDSPKLVRRSRHNGLGVNCCFFGASDDFEDELVGSDRLRSYYIPDRSDFLIVISVVQGLVSSSNRQGSIYIQTLCQNLDLHGFNHDFLTILTDVNRQILNSTHKKSQNTFDSPSFGNKLPTIISLLIRTLQFKEKNSHSRSKRSTFSSGGNSQDQDHEEQEGWSSVRQTNCNKRKNTSEKNVSNAKRSRTSKYQRSKQKMK